MRKNVAKKLLFQSVDLLEVRLVGPLLRKIVRTSSKREVAFLESLYASVDMFQILLEDRIRQLKLFGRAVPDPVHSASPDTDKASLSASSPRSGG